MTQRPDSDASGIRLNRWFTDQGICSRREADRWIEGGRVAVNGEPAVLGTKVGPKDKVSLDGRVLVQRTARPIVIAYNKPVGIECTSDPKVPNNLLDAVAYPERLVHIGRLDVMSEGLILLTNRGEIVNRILRGEGEHEKEYLVELSQPVADDQISRLARGVDIGDGRGRTKPCQIDRLGPATLRIVLTEGRNRQIRKMAEAIGNHVRRLERQRIMNLRLGTLPRGQWRHLSLDEMRELFFALGMGEPRGVSRDIDTRPTLPSSSLVRVDPLGEGRSLPRSPSNRPMRGGPNARPGPNDRPARDARPTRDDRPARDARPARDTRPPFNDRPGRDGRPSFNDDPARHARPARDAAPARAARPPARSPSNDRPVFTERAPRSDRPAPARDAGAAPKQAGGSRFGRPPRRA